MRVLQLPPAAALLAAGGMLGGCQTMASMPPSEYERLCTELGAPPGSRDYAECVAWIDEEIARARREYEQEYTDLRVDYRCSLAWQNNEPYIVCRVIDVRSYR